MPGEKKTKMADKGNILDPEDPDIEIMMLNGEKPRHILAVLHPRIGKDELYTFHALCDALARHGIDQIVQLSETEVEVDGEMIHLNESALLLALTYSGEEGKLLSLDLFRANPENVTYH
jgi:hypothetical protein